MTIWQSKIFTNKCCPKFKSNNWVSMCRDQETFLKYPQTFLKDSSLSALNTFHCQWCDCTKRQFDIQKFLPTNLSTMQSIILSQIVEPQQRIVFENSNIRRNYFCLNTFCFWCYNSSPNDNLVIKKPYQKMC